MRHPGIIRGLNFHAKQPRGASATDLEYFLDVKGNRGVWRDGVSDLVRRIDDSTGGLVIARLEDMLAHTYIDEVQDLVGYDLDVLDLLFESRIGVTVVGDPRQHLFATNEGPRNKRGAARRPRTVLLFRGRPRAGQPIPLRRGDSARRNPLPLAQVLAS